MTDQNSPDRSVTPASAEADRVDASRNHVPGAGAPAPAASMSDAPATHAGTGAGTGSEVTPAATEQGSVRAHGDLLDDDGVDDRTPEGAPGPVSSVGPRDNASAGAGSNPRAASSGADHDQVSARDHASAASTPTGAPSRPGEAPQFGVGPFSVREVALMGVWVVAFLVSFFRTTILDSPSSVLVGGSNVWVSGVWWVPAIALPTVAVGLVVLRRLSPQGIRRVGSLGIDQFASVALSVSAFVWVSWVWDTVAVFGGTGIWTRSWVVWVEAILMLAGVVLTVAAPFIPPFSHDFQSREEIPAHRSARPIRPVIARPRTPRAPRVHVDAAPAGANRTATDGTAAGGDGALDGARRHGELGPVPGSYTGSTDLTHDAAPATAVLPAHSAAEADTDVFAPLRISDADARGVGAYDASSRDADLRDASSRDADLRDADLHHADGPGTGGHGEAHDHDHDDRHGEHHRHAQAFWALAPVEREVVDDYGTPIFSIGPTAWALVIEDRGETFVIRHDDGRIGYLHDVSGVTRG